MINTLPLTDRNLIVTGYTGPNQPRVGQMAAERLGIAFLNLDVQLADRVGLPVEDVRAFYGESRLKSIESDLVLEARLRRQTVIRISARSLMAGTHLAMLGATGPIVCLVTTLDAALRRMHIAMGGRYADPNERARELGELKREWSVRGLPGVIDLDVTSLDTEQTVQAIIAIYRELSIQRA